MVSSQKSKVKSQKLKVKSQKSKVKSQKSKVKSQKSKVKSQKCAVGAPLCRESPTRRVGNPDKLLQGVFRIEFLIVIDFFSFSSVSHAV
jgi:hypothetical protein